MLVFYTPWAPQVTPFDEYRQQPLKDKACCYTIQQAVQLAVWSCCVSALGAKSLSPLKHP